MKKIYLIALLILSIGMGRLSSQDFYDINHIPIIEITFEQNNWDALLDQLESQGQEERLLASVTIDGIAYDSVGIRYKGNSTFNPNNDKNPLNIKLDHIKNHDHQGFETLKLSTGIHDPSFVREVLSYEIARKYGAAPLSNYTKVYVNGNYHGLYCNTESINGDFGERYLFADGDNARFKCNSTAQGPNSGSSLTWLGADSSLYFNRYELKSDEGWNELVDLIDLLNHEPDDIESLLDIDQVIWMLAFDNVLANLDSYIGPRQQNYYILKDDNDIFNTILWDMNECFGGFENTGNPGPPNINKLINLYPFFHEGDASYPLIKLVMANPTYKRMYIAHCRTILEENLANSWYETRGYELQSIISESVQTDPNALYSYSTFTNNMTSNVNGSGMGGAQGAYGLTQLFDARVNYLENTASYQAVPPTISNISTSPATVYELSIVTVNAQVTSGSSVILAYRHDLSEEFIKINMLDDGNHNDGTLGDGLYGIEIPANLSDIQYFIYAENDDAGIFSPQRAAYEYYEIDVNQVISDVVINEFQADNEMTVADQDDEYDDWIELYNNTDQPILLTGYFLSDDQDDLMQWTFSEVSIPANGYLIIWADNDEEQEGLHANFKLSKGGEGIFLSTPDGVILDHITFGAQTADKTTGRYPNGTGDFVEMQPTFNAENQFVSAIDLVEIQNSGVKIYPNPANDWVKIELENQGAFPAAVYNATGHRIWNGIVQKKLSLSVNHWPSGIYMLRVGKKGYLFLVE